MATSGGLGTSPGGNPNSAARLDAGTALQLSVETERGVGNAPFVVMHARASGDDARLDITLVLGPDAALDLGMRPVGCVGRLRKSEMGET
jgi:hypothetical protein